MKLEQLKKMIREIAKKEMLKEEEINWNAVENAIINFLKTNTKILDKKVQSKDTEGVKNGLKSILSGLTNAQRSLKLESASRTAMEIGGLTGLNKDVVQKFVDTHNLDIEKVFQFVKKGNPADRRDFVTAVSSPILFMRKNIIKKLQESVNKDIRSTEEKIEFFRNLKPGDKVTYLGPDKNGFTKGDIVKVLTYISNSTFQKTFTLEKNGKKLRVKSQSSVGPIDESVNEDIKAFDERSFGKNGIIIMIDDNGKKVSAIFKNRKNADKYNRNNPEDLKTLVSLANKKGFGKAIDESVNEATNSAKMMAGIKKGSQTGPWTIVVSFNKKVYYQTQVKTKNEIPAKFEHMKKVTNIFGNKPDYIITIEDSTGMTVYSEKLLNEAKKYDIGSGYLGNGLTIWNRAEEKDGDYETIAHIGKDGKLTIYDKEIPADIKKMFGIWATSMKKGNRPGSY